MAAGTGGHFGSNRCIPWSEWANTGISRVPTGGFDRRLEIRRAIG